MFEAADARGPVVSVRIARASAVSARMRSMAPSGLAATAGSLG